MIKVKDVVIGQGRPKICVPVTALDKAAAVREADDIANQLADCVDLAELRIDYLKEAKEPDKLAEVLQAVQQALGKIPLLCTLRTFKEGGELNVEDAVYGEILSACITSGAVDILDVEIFRQEEIVSDLITKAHEQQICVLASSHDFAKTPPKDELVSRLMCMERAGADIAKIAVMPKNREDVLTLLSASSIANTCMDIPVVTISMGGMGAVSRVAGRVFGSCITFGVGRKASAPGQIDAGKLKEILELL